MFRMNLVETYVVTGIRALLRHKMHLSMNILGISIGLAAALLVALFTMHESSYDTRQPNADRTYRILEQHVPTGTQYSLSSPLAFQYYKRVSGIEDYLGLLRGDWFIDTKVVVGGSTLALEKVYASTENLLDFIDLNVIDGDISLALLQPDKIAISRTEAIRFFGKANVLGRKLVSKNKTWTIAAIFTDLPLTTHFDFKALISAKFALGIQGKASFTYLRLAKNANLAQVENSITQIMADIWKAEKDTQHKLQSILDIHLAPNLREEMKVGGSQLAVNISIISSILLIIISSFNSINMNIARAGQRANEVGVRKALGAEKHQLVSQFLVESVLVYLVAGLIACGIAELFLSEFNLLVGRQLVIQYWGWTGILLALFFVIIGVFSGLYPALFISSFNAKRVLSGDLERGKTAISVRKSLLIFQSALSIGFIVVSFNIYNQLNHLQNFPINYEKSNRLSVGKNIDAKIFSDNSEGDGNLDSSTRINSHLLFQDLKKIDGIVSSTPTDFDLTYGFNAGVRDFTVQGIPNFVYNLGYGATGYDAVETLGLKLIAGRDFNQLSDWFSREDKSVSILMPESILKLAGFENPEGAIGKIARFSAGSLASVNGRIVGVIKDIKIGSVKDASYPVMFVCGLSWANTTSIIIKIKDDSTDVRNEISKLIKSRLNIHSIEIESMEAKYNLIYKEDSRLARLVLIFSILVVFLTCVGMFGLASFTAARRSKEIAIRKVLGASRSELITLLIKDYSILNIISLFIAFPAAYYVVENWLNNFNEKIEQSFLIYIFAGALVTFLTGLTISVIAFAVASSRPNCVLRKN